MKKRLCLFLLLLLVIVSKNIKAEELYYLPWRNTHYMRSQHSYAFTQDEVQFNSYIPAIYTIITDEEDVLNKEAWNFHEKYTVPWQKGESAYFLGYCADLFVDMREGEAYRKVPLEDSTYILDTAKDYITGILQQSYPFISEEEMKTILKDKQVLVEKKVGNETFLTAPANENPTRSVTLDELVSAIQTAIISHTNPDGLDSIYSGTHELTSATVLRKAGLWKLTDKKGKHDEVKNNIEAIYNYLIKQNQGLENERIKRIGFNDKQEILVGLENVNDVNELNVEIYENDDLIQKTALKNQKQDYFSNYIVSLDKKVDVAKTNIKIDGTVYRATDIFAYEAVKSKNAAQTLVGLNSGDAVLNLTYDDKIVETDENSVTLEKDSDKKYLYPGEEFEYTFKVKNNENYELTQVLVTDEVPTELEIVSTDGKVSDNKIEFVMDLKPLEEKIFKVTVRVKENFKNGKISNDASVILNNVETKSNEVTIEVIDNPQTGKNLYLPLSFISLSTLVIFFVAIKKKKLYHL